MAKRKADLRDAFVDAWNEHGYDNSDLETEHRFHPERRWRFDVAFPSLQVAVELDGFGYGHQSVAGRIKDNEKANAAIEMGWYILRYTSADMKGGKLLDAVDQVKRVLYERYVERQVVA